MNGAWRCWRQVLWGLDRRLHTALKRPVSRADNPPTCAARSHNRVMVACTHPLAPALVVALGIVRFLLACRKYLHRLRGVLLPDRPPGRVAGRKRIIRRLVDHIE